MANCREDCREHIVGYYHALTFHWKKRRNAEDDLGRNGEEGLRASGVMGYCQQPTLLRLGWAE